MTEIPLDAKSCSECGEPLIVDKEQAIEVLVDILNVDEVKAELLYKRGFTSPEKVVEYGLSGLAEIPQIGFKTAKEILLYAEEYVGEKYTDTELDDLGQSYLEELIPLDEIERVLKEFDEEDTEIEDTEIEDIEEEVEEEKKAKTLTTKIQEETKHCSWCDKDISLDKNSCPICGGLLEVSLVKRTYSSFLVPIFAFIIPLFFMIYVCLEFFTALFANPLLYPYRAILYLTPLPLFSTSWLSSVALSFLIVLGLFILTFAAFDFDTRSNKFVVQRPKFLNFTLILSLIITVSLALYIILSPIYLANVFSYVLFLLILTTSSTHAFILTRKAPEEEYFEKEELIMCFNCGTTTTISDHTCPGCGCEFIKDENFIICPICEVALLPGAKRCLNCGTQLEESEEEVTEKAEEEVTKHFNEVEKEKTSSDVITCPVCWSETPSDAQQCSECGEPFVEHSEENEDFFSDI